MSLTVGGVELLTYREAAALLDVSPQSVRVYVTRGILHPMQPRAASLGDTGDTAYKYLLTEELAWYDRRRRNPGTDPGPNPYAARYAELLAEGLILPTEAIPVEQLAAGALRSAAGPALALAAGVLAMALIFALPLVGEWIAGRKPGADALAPLRSMPGASDALRNFAASLPASEAAAMHWIADAAEPAA